MAHVAPIYPNFARGEVSPLMFGRIDIEQYPSCLDKCRNVYIRPYGCATRISGTEFIANAKNNGKVRLLKFVFSATDSYIIECGAGYFRFYQNGGAVIKDDAPAWVAGQSYKKGDFVTYDGLTYYCINGGNDSTFEEALHYNRFVQQDVYEVPNNYTEEQLDSIQYVQIDDVIKLTCLPVNGDNSTARPQELIRVSSDNWIFRAVSFVETPYLDQNTTNITLKASSVNGDGANQITLTASAPYFNNQMVGANFWIGTKVTDSATNKDVQGYVQIKTVTNSTTATATVKSKLSTAEATKLWGEGAFSDYRGWPAVVALFDGRLYYARTPYQPRNVYGSKPYAYETFTPAVDNEDDAGINIQLATNANGDGSDIKWMIGASYLLCGTYGGEFIIRSTSDGAITPTDISARQRTNWGGEPIQPIVAGTFIHFIQRNGNKLRQFQYDYYYDAYKAVDVSIFSEHLLASPIRQMALQKNPDSIIYLMREDGKVVMLTLEQDQSVQAWSLLEDLGAKVESIQTIPSYDGNYDEVYFLMLRQTLETVLNIVCSNPLLQVTNNYTGTAQEIGIVNEVLEYNIGHCNVSQVQGSGGVINYNTGKYNTVASGTSYVYCYTPYSTKYIFKPANAVWFEVVIGLSYISGYATEQCILSSDSATAGIKIYITAQNKFRLVLSDGTNSIGTVEEQTGTHTINTGSTPYLIRVRNANHYTLEYSTDNGVTWVTDITVNSSTMINSNTNIILGCDWNGSNYVKKFIGEIDLNKCSIKYNQDPDDPIIIPNWEGVGGIWTNNGQVVNLSDYNINVVGSPNQGDTLNLTFITSMSNPVRYIERITTPITSDNPNEWWYVRAGLEYNAYKFTSENTLSLTSNTGIVEVTAQNPIFNLNHVGRNIRAIDSKGNTIGEGTITGHISSYKMTMTVTKEFQNLVIQGGYWGISVTSISGLDHLIGQNVQVVIDGYESNITKLTTGSITLDNPAYRILAGLPYQSYITTMPMEAGSQNGTSVGKRKRISEMAIRVWNSIGVRVGRDLDNLYDTIYEQQEPYTGVIPNIKYNQGWVWDANITVEQSHPYPMNILSIAPLVTEVDK